MNRIDREKEYHNKIWDNNARNVTDKFYSITKPSHQYYIDHISEFKTGKSILEYGCGPGSSAIFLAKNGANVTGIDISETAIAAANEQVKNSGIDINFRVMNAECLDFENNSFDLVCGTGILHHLNYENAYAEIARVLSPNGLAIFLEPLGHNPLINLYRNRTPHLRTPDEHPLLINDIEFAKTYFKSINVQYFHLTSLLSVPFRNNKNFNKIVSFFTKIDTQLIGFLPYLGRYAWTVAMKMSLPIK
jgi:ubiquinone/menaquinone biosynthesis C-methylase UbiE